MSYRMTLVEANNQQRPLLRWLVIGAAVYGNRVLNMWASATFAWRESNAVFMSVWSRMARERATFAS